jgi:hypothetical protein
MRWRTAIFGTLGALTTLVAGAVVVAPELLETVPALSRLVEQLSNTDPKLVMLAATLVVGLYVAVAARSSTTERTLTPVSDAERRFDGALVDPPEAVTADQRSLTAAALDSDIDTAVEHGGERLQSVRRLLADLVTETYADVNRLEESAAREAVASGTWTDDRVAAAFLGDEDGPDPSLLSRIRLWLTPERERERRIDRTLSALGTLTEGER